MNKVLCFQMEIIMLIKMITLITLLWVSKAKNYAPVVILSARDNQKLSELETWFERSV